MPFSQEVIERLELLEKKYNAMGQDLLSYLDGLLYADYLTYWDYIHLDTLLSLQTPKTPFPDEKIFIVYHQITELYFNLCLHELKQIQRIDSVGASDLLKCAQRVSRYFQNLVHSFEVMVDGMDPQQFLKYRMSLLPASGFQSVQYRMIEIHCTDFIQLVNKDVREQLKNAPLNEQFNHIYWKEGATELASGKQTLTLRQFDQKYHEQLLKLANECANSNLRALYRRLQVEDKNNPALIKALKSIDVLVNINWPLSHYKSAVRYLQKDPEDIKATGGTNWQKYLPPRFQKRIFFPELWSTVEIENWGKGWVEDVVFGKL
jgi:tryptophan 2,3-dioxygenase